MKTAELNEKKKRGNQLKVSSQTSLGCPGMNHLESQDQSKSLNVSSFIKAYYLVCKWNKRHSFTNAEIMRVSDF